MWNGGEVLEWNIDDRLPIWSQLTEQLTAFIAAGRYGPGERLPSVREFAADAGVNPNTMQRALSDLEQRGLIVTRGTSGRTVTEDASRIKELRRELAEEKLQQFMDSMRELGFTEAEIRNVIRDAIKEEKLWQPGNEKEYYTRLTDTVRSYLDGELGISAMEQTSTEILCELKQCDKVEAVEREKIEEMLTTADYVKFAKFTPLQDENARHLDTAYAFVQTTHERLQAEEQRRAEEERKRLEEEKKADEEADKKNNVQ